MKRLIHFILTFLHERLTGVKPPPGFIATMATLSLVLGIGTIFYTYQEGWSYLNSFYFSVVTLATVGYGDLYPTTSASKLFTVAYIFIGVGLGFVIFSTLARSFIDGRDRRIKTLEKLLGTPKKKSD